MKAYNPDTCNAQYSIQREINNIAKDGGGAEWAKLITDKAWREQTRLRLRDSTETWCDYKANTCACE